jgi:hypothetical protein
VASFDSQTPLRCLCNTLKARYAPYTGGRAARWVVTPEGSEGKQPKSDTNDRSRSVSAEDCTLREGAPQNRGAPPHEVYKDSLTKRPMRAYFSGFCARIAYAYPIEMTGTATPMMPSHETGTDHVPEPIVKSSLT